MAAKLQTMRSGGTQHPEEIVNFMMSQLVSVPGVYDLAASKLLVTQETVPAMSVKVAQGAAFLKASGALMAYPGILTDADASVAISSNSSGNPRKDAIVLYVDKGATPNPDITNVLKLVAIAGTPAGSPVSPSDATIQAAIGSANPFLRLADVTVASGAVSILNASILDTRVEVKFKVQIADPTLAQQPASKNYVDGLTHAATGKTTPVDADEMPLQDSAASFALKKVTWANVKATLKTYFDTLYRKIGDLTAFSDLSLATGQVINGKIVVTVASNNITLALKGADGNDPSATNPVYCKIGGVIRSVTAALAVTKNAGTNWMNAGSAELATKEIDYFAYLGYNATDGVTIGFSRIPWACQYSDFSATTTNERYAAISTITNAAATDYYNVIGRFAATLSAGAGYTWSVPTFTAINLIQKPIYITRWLAWAPQFSAGGSMTYTSVTPSGARYKVGMGVMWLNLFAAGTVGGTPSIDLRASVPMLIYGGSARCTVYAYDSSAGTGRCGWCNMGDGQGYINFDKFDASNWLAGASREIGFMGEIPIL